MIRVGSALVAALLLAGCGGKSSQTFDGHGFGNPRAAVEAFIKATGDLGTRADVAHDPTPLAAACAMLSPDIRPAIRFEQSPAADPGVECSRGLSLLVYYTGENSGIQPPQGYSGTVVGVDRTGDRAVVTVRMSYSYPTGSRQQTTRVLAVERGGMWWIATPDGINIGSSISGPPTTETLMARYQQYLDAAHTAEAQSAAANKDASVTQPTLSSCPSNGASQAADAPGDIRISDGMQIASQQPGSADLVSALHSRDGDSLCFELQFAGSPPPEGSVDIRLRPEATHVTVTWKASGQVLGDTGTPDEPTPAHVEVTRGGNAMTFRTSASVLGDPAAPYRWAVELFVPVPNDRVAYVDSIPDDLTIFQDTDHYIVHNG